MGSATYRARQFFTALLADVEPDEIETALRLAALPERAATLFRRMPRPYQRHALNVLARLNADGNRDTMVMQAALLHDIGKWDPKSNRRVGLFYRVATTILQRSAPTRRLLARLGAPAARIARWRFPFVLQYNHPRWGAKLAQEAGVSAEVVQLIWLHEQPSETAPAALHERLATLQRADDQE